MDVIGQISIKRRNTGQTAATCFSMSLQLKSGLTVGIMDMRGTEEYTQRVRHILKSEYNIHTISTPIFKLVPHNNRQVLYDRWGEPIGINILPQKKVILGYTLRMFDIDSDWHPNETI